MHHRYSATQAQRELLEFIKGYAAEHGVAPSYGEMAEATDSWRNAVHRRVEALVERGHLRKIPNRARALAVIPERVPLSYPSPRAEFFVVQRVDDQAVLVPMEGKR